MKRLFLWMFMQPIWTVDLMIHALTHPVSSRARLASVKGFLTWLGCCLAGTLIALLILLFPNVSGVQPHALLIFSMVLSIALSKYEYGQELLGRIETSEFLAILTGMWCTSLIITIIEIRQLI